MSLYKVEKIVDRRINKGVLEYKVKWQGYSDDDCTWQPLKNLKTVEDMIKEFQRNLLSENEVTFEENEEKQQQQQEEEEEEQQKEIGDEGEQFYRFDMQEPDKEGEDDNWEEEKGEDRFDIQFDDFSAEEDSKTMDELEKCPAPKKVYKHENSHHFSKQKKNPLEVELSEEDLLPQKSYLQQVEQRTRFVTKAPPKKPTSQIARQPQPGELKVLHISKCSRTNQFIYLTQFGPVVCFRTHADMRMHYSDELVKFYESKIEFAKIPKISR